MKNLKREMSSHRARRFLPDIANHIYQISEDKGIVFYGDEDMLVLYTIQSVMSRRFGITVYAASYMLNHIHQLSAAHTGTDLSAYVGKVTSLFSTEYNKAMGRSGQLFRARYGSAPKEGGKKFRSCFNYIANNAPEKKICKRAVEYRWNFLAYAVSDCPFSVPFQKSRASKKMRLAVDIVIDYFRKGHYLNYSVIGKLKGMLSKNEWQQLIDIIIVTYRFIRYDLCAEYFNGIENMLKAPETNLGEDREIAEEYGSSTYAPYYKMIKELYSKGYTAGKRSPFMIPTWDRNRIISEFGQKRMGSYNQISRLFHLSVEEVKEIIWHPDLSNDI